MDSDSPQNSSRRRLIRLGTIGLTTGMAGCSQFVPNSGPVEESDPIESDPPESDTAPDGRNNNLPDDPPAEFSAPTADYTFHHLHIRRGENPDPANLSLRHKDSSIFTVEIQTENSATATLERTNVSRDIDLRLNIRDANGNFHKTSPQTLSATDEDTFEDRNVTFNISNISLPTGGGSICELISTDTHPDDDAELVFKRHQFVGVPHKGGTNWINTERVNHSYYVEDGRSRKDYPRGVNESNPNSQPAGHVSSSVSENEITVFLAARTSVNGEVFGVSAHVDKDAYYEYINSGRSYHISNGLRYECHYAQQISHLQELGTKTAQAISDIGITNSRERLEALGDLVQMIPYEVLNEAPPTVVLSEQKGDCSEKSALMVGILRNDPWNMMPAFIDCAINGGRHWTVGIDVNDIGGVTNSDFTVAPYDSQISSGLTDTEYAFFDMTWDSNIGQRGDGISGYDGEPIHIHDEGDFKSNTDQLGTPPDY